MGDAVDAKLAQLKIEADEIADTIRNNLDSLEELASEHKFLFADHTELVLKNNDDLVNLIKMRIADHEKAEELRLEEERARIQAEEEAKAKRKAEAEANAERERIRKEERQKAQAEEREAENSREIEEVKIIIENLSFEDKTPNYDTPKTTPKSSVKPGHNFESHIGDNTAVTIEFEYTPEVAAIINPVDSAQPGEGALVEDLFVFIGDDDITEYLCEEALKDFEKEARQHMANME